MSEETSESKAKKTAKFKTTSAEGTDKSPVVKNERSKARKVKSEMAQTRVLFTGRRKTAISRVKVTAGNGQITVNKKPLEEYFKRKSDVKRVKQPLLIIQKINEFNVSANVSGGGNTGQAEAIRMSIARSLKNINPEYSRLMRENGLLTRDSRMVERKKYGLHKARRASQFSKR